MTVCCKDLASLRDGISSRPFANSTPIRGVSVHPRLADNAIRDEQYVGGEELWNSAVRSQPC
jgi:hypothetical protein